MRKSFDFPKGSRIHYNDVWVTNEKIILYRKDFPLAKNLQTRLNKYSKGTIEHYKTRGEICREGIVISYIQARWEEMLSQYYNNYDKYIEINPTRYWVMDKNHFCCIFTSNEEKVFVGISEHYYWLPLEYNVTFAINKTKIRNGVYIDEVFIRFAGNKEPSGALLAVDLNKEAIQVFKWEEIKKEVK